MANFYTILPRRTLSEAFGLRYCICDYPDIMQTQERITESASPLIKPLWEVRIFCPNCYRASPWCRDFPTAVLLWNEAIVNRGSNE